MSTTSDVQASEPVSAEGSSYISTTIRRVPNASSYESFDIFKKVRNICISRDVSYLLTPWSSVFLEKLTVAQLVKKFFRRFIIVFI
jgi:hypothetical protein